MPLPPDMSAHGFLLKLRLQLDAEITYGSKRRALLLAREGVRRALKERLLAEEAYFRGQVELINGRFAGAIEFFDRAIALNQNDGAAYNDRALCLVELGFIDRALEDFDRGIAVEPDFATIHHNKGWLLNNIGRHTEALACLRAALSLEPKRAVTYDNLADALLSLGDYRGALAAYKKVLALLRPRAAIGIRKNIRERIREIESVLHKKKTRDT